MRKLTFAFITFILISCNTHKSDKVVFISLYPQINWDSLGVPQLVVRQYAEFSLATNDSLIVSKAGHIYEVDNMKIPKFGIDSFSRCKVDEEFEKTVTKLMDGDIKETYRRTLSEGSIDDRNMDFIIIIRDNLFKIIPYEHNYLPEELKQVDNKIDRYVNSTSLVRYKHNNPIEIISHLQDSLFKKLPPPPRPLKSTVRFTPPVIND